MGKNSGNGVCMYVRAICIHVIQLQGNQIQFNFSKLFKTEKVHFNCLDPQRIEIWETFEEVLKTLFKIFKNFL